MPYFDNLSEKITKVVQLLSEDQILVRLLRNTTDNPLSNDIEDIDGKDLIFREITPIPKLINTKTTEKAFVVIDFVGTKVNRATLTTFDETLRFVIMCHLNIAMIKNSQIRALQIMNRIDSIFNGSNEKVLGYGTVIFDKMSRITANENWYGYYIDYKLSDNSNRNC